MRAIILDSVSIVAITDIAYASFLADRTNGRAYATVLRLSSVRPSVRLGRYVLWLNGAS